MNAIEFQNRQRISLILLFMIGFIFSNGQTVEQFDIVTYAEPSGWVKENGNGFIDSPGS